MPYRKFSRNQSGQDLLHGGNNHFQQLLGRPRPAFNYVRWFVSSIYRLTKLTIVRKTLNLQK